MSTSTDSARIRTYSFTEPFIEQLADDIFARYGHTRDLSRVAVVFGGKRPALFLKRALSRRMKSAFIPPVCLTIDEFIDRIVKTHEDVKPAVELDHAHALFTIAKETAPAILRNRGTFARFLSWAREILAFIEQLDLEEVPDSRLKAVEASAHIGFAVPDEINRLLEHIIILRRAFHSYLEEHRTYARGFRYRKAAEYAAATPLPEFDDILFCNFFYFHKTEERIVKTFYERGQARLFFQGDQRKWPVLERAGRAFGVDIKEGERVTPTDFKLKLYAGFDAHSQIATVREILKGVTRPEEAVIVLPNADMVVPLLSEISSIVEDFNVSVGYPLKRSSFYSLLQYMFAAQRSRRKGQYYAKDYLRVLRHPFVKNLAFGDNPVQTRILTHKIEEVLTGEIMADISGCLYFNLEDVERCDEIFNRAGDMLGGMGFPASPDLLKRILAQVHALVFRTWEDVRDFASLSAAMSGFLNQFQEKSFMERFRLNIKIMEHLRRVNAELLRLSFQQEEFPMEDLFRIMEEYIEKEMVSFIGSPLKGLQILGLFETRSLNFKDVIVLDVNEGSLPHLEIYEPLIPREVKLSLNLDRLEWEEQIQRYQFMRLISSAENVHLVFKQARDKERSRFIEELIWEEEKRQGRLKVVPIIRPSFHVKIHARLQTVAKTHEMIRFLQDFRFSASSVNMYLRNPMDFFYNYCYGLREKEDLLDEPEGRQVGTFLHDLLEEAFRPFIGGRPMIDEDFRNRLFRRFDTRFAETFERSQKSDAFLMRSVLLDRLHRFCDFEAQRPVESLLHIEQLFEDRLILAGGIYRFAYRVDRVDKLTDGRVQLIDYKTGSVDPMPGPVYALKPELFSREYIYETVPSFQMPLYYSYMERAYAGESVDAAFYNLRTMNLNGFMPKESAQQRHDAVGMYLRALDFMLGEILNPDVPFVDEPLNTDF